MPADNIASERGVPLPMVAHGFLRRFVAVIAAVMTAVASALPVRAAAVPLPPLSAASAILVNADTGQILYGRNIRHEHYPASITKIMTAYLAIVHGWNKTVTVSTLAQDQTGSSNYLRAGERLPMPDVVTAMMLTSGNDSAVAVAQTVSGSVPAFVKLMNATAAKWHAPGIHFANPSGLPNPHHVVTALGMAIIAEHAMQNPIFRQIVRTKRSSLPPNPSPRVFFNQNRLLYTYPGAIGIKLGWTPKAGETVVVAAQRNGMTLIAVLLHDTPNGLWPDAARLLSYGFDHFTSDPVLSAATPLLPLHENHRTIPVRADQTVSYLRKTGDGAAPVFEYLPRNLGNRPVIRGETVGMVEVSVANQVLGTVPLLANATVAPIAPKPHWNWLHLAGALAAALTVAGLWLAVPRKRIRTKSGQSITLL